MTQPSELEGRAGLDSRISIVSPPPRTSRLMSGIYHDIGLAAVASGLEIELEADCLAPEVIAAVKRGARYINLMPRA